VFPVTVGIRDGAVQFFVYSRVGAQARETISGERVCARSHYHALQGTQHHAGYSTRAGGAQSEDTAWDGSKTALAG
jgi:hypothetical protein